MNSVTATSNGGNVGMSTRNWHRKDWGGRGGRDMYMYT